MAEITKVVLDAMGGDNAPVEMVKGAVDATGKEKNVKVFLVGKEELVKSELDKYTYDRERIEIVNATEVIETAEPPVKCNQKKEGFFYSSGHEDGEGRRCRCFCVCRQFRSNSCRRSDIGRPNQGCRASAACAADPDGEGSSTFDRLRSQRRCTPLSFGAVCQNGIHLYGTCGGS